MIADRTKPSAWYVVVLGGWLLAAPAQAEPNVCEAKCAGAFSAEVQACLKRCPKSKHHGKRDEFQACASKCSARFDRSYKKCAKGCGGEEAAESHHSHDTKKKKRKNR